MYTAGGGIFRSTNDGDNWIRIDPDTNLGSSSYSVIKADPLNEGVVYSGGLGTLFKSTNYGDDWEILGLGNKKVSRFEIDPNDPNIIYVGLSNGTDDVLWKTTDGGIHWEKKTNGLPTSNLPIRTCLAIKIDPQSIDHIYCSIYLYGIYESTDGGDNWKKISPLEFAHDIEIISWLPGTLITAAENAVYKTTDNGVTWKPILNESLRSLEVNNITEEIYAGLNRSTDDGKTWQSLANDELPLSFSTLDRIEDIRIKPTIDSILYIATGSGIYKSVNKGTTWVQRFDGLNDFAPYCLAVSESNPSIIYTAGREGIHRSTDGGNSWKYDGGVGTVTNITIDPTNADIVYAAQVSYTSPNYIWRTTDGGNNWQQIISNAIPFDFIRIDPSDPSIIYCSYLSNKYVIAKSDDRGDTWHIIDIPVHATDLAITKKVTSYMYIGTVDGVYKSIDAGLTWNYLGLPPKGHRILLSLTQEDEIYASVYGTGVFKSYDGGVQWELKNQGLPDTIPGAMIPDPKQIGRVFLNTLDGVYVSIDGGDNWNKLYSEDAQNIYYLLGVDTSATGRVFGVKNFEPGIYTYDSIYADPSSIEENNLPKDFVLYQNYPNPFNPTTSISYQLPKAGHVTLKIYDVLGNEISELVNEWKETGSYSVKFTTTGKRLASGMYFFTLTAGKFTDTKMFILLK